jgi:hypothetical protein
MTLTRINTNSITDGSIIDADINASAAIAGTKISPDFGSQTIATTGIVSHALGTAGAPTVTFTGDTNTGIYSPGADQFAITTGGSGRVFVDSSGRVGLGTSSVVSKFQISNSGAEGYEFNPGDAANVNATFHYNRTSSAWIASRIGASYHRFDVSGSESMRLTSTGLGIGDNAPDATLVTKGAGISDVAFAIKHAWGASSTALLTASNSSGEVMRLQRDGKLLVGTSSTSGNADAQTALIQTIGNSSASFQGGRINIGRAEFSANITSGEQLGGIYFSDAQSGTYGVIECVADGTGGSNDFPGRLVFSTTADGASSPTERMRITNDGQVRIANTSGINISSSTDIGAVFEGSGTLLISRDGNIALSLNRQNSDGGILSLRQAGVEEGSISVSGTTVQLNGAHLSRWSQLLNGGREDILRGTVLSNLNEMCEWGDQDNEQLNRMKVSDVDGDPNVAGVFVDWDNDDDTYTDDFYCAMTGDFIIRIAEGVTVQRGDLLMSAGDGTAKPQDDDIIRSKTIAKVTSTHVTCTYDDGSYCVPCVLMAC